MFLYIVFILIVLVSCCEIIHVLIFSTVSELRHHRHWQPALEHLVGCKFRMLSQILPNEGMILGGSVSLQGKNLSLASFHGINFRSKSWAIFNIKEPDIYFSTEAQKTSDGGILKLFQLCIIFLVCFTIYLE